jgi:RNA polymerase sigma factor (sigma-70 family)
LLVGDFFAGEEIAQDAFARLVNVSSGVANPGAYLRVTAVNLARSRIRRAIVVRRHQASQYSRPPTSDEGPDAVVARVTLLEELAKLPRRQREAMVLRFYAGLTDAEIADAMGVTVGSVKTHVHRAMAALVQRIEALR